MFRFNNSAEHEAANGKQESPWLSRLQWLGGVAAAVGTGIIAANQVTFESAAIADSGVMLLGIGIYVTAMAAFARGFPAGHQHTP